MEIQEYDPNPVLQIPNILIKKNKLTNKDIIGTKYDYEKIGSNGFIEIKPKMVKFTGFEINKTNIQRISVVNSAAISQRVHILPPMSPYFQIKFDKKGNLAPGISEEITLIFKPSEYKYYFDSIKIHTETDKFQIPIHAYPVLNRDNIRDIFPKLIDFGYVEIGEQEKRVYPLICKIPLNFEYEFTFIKEHPDVYVHPSKGMIPGKGSVDIEISYTPSVNITIDVELELKISQFDFEPLIIRIKGTGKNKIEKNTKTMLEPIKKQSLKQYIMEKTEGNPEESTGKKEFKTLMKTNKTLKSLRKSMSFNKEQEESKKRTVTPRQLMEKEFFDHSNSVFQLCKDRDIKFFTCLGDPWISEENRAKILDIRTNYENDISKAFEFNGVHRYNLQQNYDLPINEEILPENDSTWDIYKNDLLENRNKIILKFVEKGTYVIIQSRMMKRLAKIKIFLGDAKTREEVKRKVTIDWLKYEYAGVGKKDHVSFKFNLSAENFDKINFAYQYESSNTFGDFNFQVNPKMTFDDLAPFPEINRDYLKEFTYKEITLPAILIQPTVENRVIRTGAEEEYFSIGSTGSHESTGDKLQIELPSTMLKLFDYEFNKYITKHASLRKFTRLCNISEIDPEFDLITEKITFQDALDPQPLDDFYVLKYEFLSKTPGFFGIHAINFMNVEMSNYFKERIIKPYEYGVNHEIERKAIEMMQNDDQDDHFTDSDSDGDGPPDVMMEDFNDFLKKIEADDKIIKDIRDSNEKDIQDEYFILKNSVSMNIQNEKDKWTMIMPSKTADFNKFIELNDLKILIH